MQTKTLTSCIKQMKEHIENPKPLWVSGSGPKSVNGTMCKVIMNINTSLNISNYCKYGMVFGL